MRSGTLTLRGEFKHENNQTQPTYHILERHTGAFGAGAHGYVIGYRYSNVLRIRTYIDRLVDRDHQVSNLEFPLSPAAVNQHKQTIQDNMSEFMMTGLRLTQEGVTDNEFQARFGKTMRDIYGKEIEELLKLELIESISPTRTERTLSERQRDEVDVEARGEGEILTLTKRGRLLGNQVFMRFV